MKLKVCGMKYKDNILDVAELQPDYLGFIFYEGSKRYFNGNIPNLPKTIKKVGVFVNSELNDIINLIHKYDLDVVQLHGNESPEFCRILKDYKVEVIKVFCIEDAFNFSLLNPFENVCDFFLFDTKGKLPGGNGYAFNWNVLENYTSTKPFFLSGGIGLDDAKKLNDFKMNKSSKYCHAIDVNSKFEIEPGNKNIKDIAKFKNEI